MAPVSRPVSRRIAEGFSEMWRRGRHLHKNVRLALEQALFSRPDYFFLRAIRYRYRTEKETA